MKRGETMASDYLIRIDGEVQRPRQFVFEDLLAVEERYQIDDVRQWAPQYEGKAIQLNGLLAAARIKPTAKYLGLHSSHDDFHASVPLDAVREQGIVIYSLDGRHALTVDSGGPTRFYIRDHASCNVDDIDECANVKFLDHIELTVERGFDNRPQDEAEHARLHAEQEN
ncbi:MAG TPA: hypothetical protein EYN03_03345 [Planctomycetes bacterium]|nr:hypothetical protein [Planctomycetaceae bacterium]HIN94657.1 hypothetical protein [Planctomycetota bacterium]